MKVLVAVDDSSCSSLALAHVLARCWPQGTEFRVISVVDSLFMRYSIEGAYMPAVVEAQQQFLEDTKVLVQGMLKEMKRSLGEAAVDGQVVEGNPADCILEAAMSWKADLIVLGSHGRRGFEKLLLGSVAERVARLAPCSVEIVKKKLADDGNAAAA